MPELLLELFSEEIPARMQDRAADELAAAIKGVLTPYELIDGPVRAFATPRRLGVVAEGVKAERPLVGIVRKGPPTSAPEKAVEGFKRSLAGDNIELTTEEHGGREFHIARITNQPRPVTTILVDEFPKLLAGFSWPKSMRWSSSDARWVRPLHSILCLFDGQVVPFTFAGVQSGDTTFGHRFMAAGPILVRDFADYRDKLYSSFVEIDASERRKTIEAKALRLAEGRDLRLRSDPGLLDELKGLVEWPVPLMGRIDEASMALPAEVLTTSMRTHQRYLALESSDGSLAPWFITVANIETPDQGATIIAGNEYVLRARLWDARFFWEQDRKRPLESYLPGLDQMVFHAELGSLGQRVERLVALSGRLVPHLPGADRATTERAALLAKADLRTGMVGEFPELQGVMGGHYARAQGEDEAVARAIAEHYAPKGPDDRCPSEPASVAVALAEKIDALAGFFAADIKPTGSKDPFALRRAALGVIRLVLENRLRLPLRQAFGAALDGYGERFAGRGESTIAELLRFFADRLKVHLRGEGVRHDLVSAVFAVGEEDDLVRLLARVDALNAFLVSEDGRNLLTAYRRASNIVGIEEKKDKRRYEGAPDPALLREPAERALHEALLRVLERIEAALATEDYAGAMTALAELRAPVDEFFDRVMVNADEPELRASRLRLLGLIRSALGRVADFGLIEDVGP
jgi:glycyl-tRNA synthetase beta chain